MGVSGSSWCLLGLKNLGDSQSPDEWQDHAHARAADSLLEYYVNSGFSSSPDASWNWFATTLQLAGCCLKSLANGEVVLKKVSGREANQFHKASGKDEKPELTIIVLQYCM